MSTASVPPDACWFEQMANRSDTLFYVIRVKPDLAFEYANGAIETIFGYTVDEAFENPTLILDAIHSEPAHTLESVLQMAPGHEMVLEFTAQHRDGHSTYARAFVRSRQRDDGSVVLEGATLDVSKLHRTESELRHSERRYRLLVENGWDVVWTTSVEGTLTYISPAIERLRGLSAGEVMQRPLHEVADPEMVEFLRNYYGRALEAIKNGTELLPTRLEHETSRRLEASVEETLIIPHVDDDGHVVEIIGVTRDITERRTFENELRRLAVTDALTGVWNRRHGEELLCADLDQALEARTPMALLVLDIDHFKKVNDTRGHQAGDRVLIEVSRRLLRVCRDADMIARWGGEEFVILLRDCDLAQGMGIAEEIRAAIAATPFIDAGTVTASIGISELASDDDLTSWLARADEALYVAKRSGRNMVKAS